MCPSTRILCTRCCKLLSTVQFFPFSFHNHHTTDSIHSLFNPERLSKHLIIIAKEAFNTWLNACSSDQNYYVRTIDQFWFCVRHRITSFFCISVCSPFLALNFFFLLQFCFSFSYCCIFWNEHKTSRGENNLKSYKEICPVCSMLQCVCVDVKLKTKQTNRNCKILR